MRRKIKEYQRDYYTSRLRKVERELYDVDERMSALAIRGSVRRTMFGDRADELRELRERKAALETARRTLREQIRRGEME